MVAIPTYPAFANRASLAKRIKARIPTYWRYLREEPSWILMFLFARTLAGRRFERWINRAKYRNALAVPDTILGEIPLNNVVDELIGKGVSQGLRLPAALVDEIVEFAESTLCFSRDKQEDGFLPKDVADVNKRRERDVIAAYYFDGVEKSPTIMLLSRDAGLRSIAQAYVGCEPVLIRIRLWWSFPATRVSDEDLHAAAQEKYHFDLNGWRTLKFFFYLTPTTANSGAHRCIPGSHARRALNHQFTLTVGRANEELQAYYGSGCFLTITGEAGSGFSEDPFVFHTGSLCRDQPRLILEIEYGSTALSPSYKYGRLG